MQPNAVREESQPVAGSLSYEAESGQDSDKFTYNPKIKRERNPSSSSLMEPDSTSSQEISNGNVFGSANPNLNNLCLNLNSVEVRTSEDTDISTSLREATGLKPENDGNYYPEHQKPSPEIKDQQPLPSLSSNDNLNADISDFDLSYFINQITQPEGSYKSEAENQLPLAANTFIPFETKPNPFQLSQDPSTMFTMTISPDFSALDPISFVKHEPKPKRKMIKQEPYTFNHSVPNLPDNPNRHLVPQDLQMKIILENPTRGIKFTYSQRMNTQMVVDDFVLKKKKGPYLTRGGRVVNWKCTNEQCHYTAVTWEGQIQDTARQHNHPRQPELYAKKQARVRIRENMVQEVSNMVQEENPVTNVVMDVVTDTNPEMRNVIGSIDALKQVARRINRKLQKDNNPVEQPQMMIDSSTLITNIGQYQDYEVVGEFPADYQFTLEVSDQGGLFTDHNGATATATGFGDVLGKVDTSNSDVDFVNKLDKETAVLKLRGSEQVDKADAGNIKVLTVEELSPDYIANENKSIRGDTEDSLNDSDISESYNQDDIEGLLETSSPSKLEEPLQEEVIFP